MCIILVQFWGGRGGGGGGLGGGGRNSKCLFSGGK